ncbi:MAG: glycosyltransferase [Kiritimatiellae bacterium]|nr:glycosyltransferase [Kiritimatiellia bacterium]
MHTNDKLCIAFITDVCHESKSGGARSAKRFIGELSRKHDVRVVTTGTPRPGHVVMPGFYVPFARHLMRGMDFAFAWPRGKPLEKLFREVDVVHIHLPFLLGFRSLQIARRLGVPVIAGFHVQPENLLYNVGLRSERLAAHLNRFLVSRFYNRCHAVVCPSTFAESELRRNGLRRPSFVISNGIPAQFRPQAAGRKFGARADFVLLMVGRLAREKKHAHLIRAVELSRHAARIRLIICGKGPLQADIARLGRRLVNPPEMLCVSDEELIRLYNTADLFVHASDVELEGMSVLEAMGCGLPALIADTRLSAARQFAMDERFLFQGNEPISLADRIDYWIEHPHELQAASRRCLQLAGQYTLEECARKLENVYFKYLFKRSGFTPANKP